MWPCLSYGSVDASVTIRLTGERNFTRVPLKNAEGCPNTQSSKTSVESLANEWLPSISLVRSFV